MPPSRCLGNGESSCSNGSKIRFCCASGIPGPESDTAIRCAPSGERSSVTSTRPSGRELDRVVDQVREHQLDQPPIGGHQRRRRPAPSNAAPARAARPRRGGSRRSCCTLSPRSKRVVLTTTCPPSMRAYSSSVSIISRRRPAENAIRSSDSWWRWSRSAPLRCMRSTCRQSAVSGVRSSCEIMPRKRVLSWLVRWASSRAAVAAASRRLGARHRRDVLERLNDEATVPSPSPPPASSSRSTGGAPPTPEWPTWRAPGRRRRSRSTSRRARATPARDRGRRAERPASSDVRSPAGAAKRSQQFAPQHLLFGQRGRAQERGVHSHHRQLGHAERQARRPGRFEKRSESPGPTRSPFLRSRKAHLSHPPPSDCRLTFLQTRPDCQEIKVLLASRRHSTPHSPHPPPLRAPHSLWLIANNSSAP